MAEWRDITGYNGEYQVSADGCVRRKTLTYRNRHSSVVTPKHTLTGYVQVWLGGREGQNHYVHRLVAFAFLGAPPSDAHQIAHWDGDKSHNSVANLRWATRSENSRDKRRLGEHPKLTQQQVNEIRSRANESSIVLAREFGVGHTHIRRIILGSMWN